MAYNPRRVAELDDKLWFGRKQGYVGRTVEWMIDNDPSFLLWATEHVNGFNLSEYMIKQCEEKVYQSKLRNCPFCGNKAKLETSSIVLTESKKSINIAYVKCTSCKAKTRDIYDTEGTQSKSKELIASEAWNNRS